MKKFLLVLTALIFTCSIAYGATKQFGDNFKKVLEKYDGSTSYIDTTTISQTDDIVTFDMIIDYVNNKENVRENIGKINKNMGMIIKPPPMPNNPVNIPDILHIKNITRYVVIIICKHN